MRDQEITAKVHAGNGSAGYGVPAGGKGVVAAAFPRYRTPSLGACPAVCLLGFLQTPSPSNNFQRGFSPLGEQLSSEGIIYPLFVQDFSDSNRKIKYTEQKGKVSVKF